jgi:8-oxo-dGTP pyrophosphatase MutT (NUDIX family)
MKPWKWISGRLVQRTRIFDLRYEVFVSPRTGQEIEATIVQSPDWVNTIALTPSREVVLIRQFRFGIGAHTVEIPAGMVNQGEEPLAAARRELKEETGYDSDSWSSLGSILPNPAFQNNRLYCFLAENCRKVAEQDQDPGEDIEVVLRELERIPGMLASGEIDHALIAIAFQKLDLKQRGLELE